METSKRWRDLSRPNRCQVATKIAAQREAWNSESYQRHCWGSLKASHTTKRSGTRYQCLHQSANVVGIHDSTPKMAMQREPEQSVHEAHLWDENRRQFWTSAPEKCLYHDSAHVSAAHNGPDHRNDIKWDSTSPIFFDVCKQFHFWLPCKLNLKMVTKRFVKNKIVSISGRKSQNNWQLKQWFWKTEYLVVISLLSLSLFVVALSAPVSLVSPSTRRLSVVVSLCSHTPVNTHTHLWTHTRTPHTHWNMDTKHRNAATNTNVTHT